MLPRRLPTPASPAPSEVCPWVSRFPTSSFLQIPSRDGHPCFRLYLSRYRADLGLAPLRNVRRQAHCKQPPDIAIIPGDYSISGGLPHTQSAFCDSLRNTFNRPFETAFLCTNGQNGCRSSRRIPVSSSPAAVPRPPGPIFLNSSNPVRSMIYPICSFPPGASGEIYSFT